MSAGNGGVAGITGTPAEVARLRAATLLPSVRMISGVGPDENDAFAIAGLDELGVLRQESVAGVNGIGLRLDGDAQDVFDVEVGIHGRLAATHQVGLVGLGSMQRKAVFLRVDRDGADAQFVGSAHDANRDFTAIGDEQAADASQHGWLLLI